MKNNKKLLILSVIFSGLLFAGCQGGEQPSENNAQPSEKRLGDKVDLKEIPDIELPDGQILEKSEPNELTVEELIVLQDKLTEIVVTEDKEKCKELTVAQFFISCEANILANSATSNDDVRVCEDSSDISIKEQCLSLLANKKF